MFRPLALSACTPDEQSSNRNDNGFAEQRGPPVAWDYVQEVPLAFYGPGFIKSRGTLDLDRLVTLADVAPTLAELVGTVLPGERPGRPISERLDSCPLNCCRCLRPTGWQRGRDRQLLLQGVALGLVGHGAYLEGGDKDIVFLNETTGKFQTNRSYYAMPDYATHVPGLDEYTEQVDRADGRADGLWMGNDLLETTPADLRDSPAWAQYQTDIATTIMERQGFGDDDITDLFFMKYKQIDELGHRSSMLEPEVREIVTYSDAELERLASWLDDNVGEREWVLMVTADHGQAPLLSAAVPGQ